VNGEEFAASGPPVLVDGAFGFVSCGGSGEVG
jgi:hypothetical protein